MCDSYTWTLISFAKLNLTASQVPFKHWPHQEPSAILTSRIYGAAGFNDKLTFGSVSHLYGHLIEHIGRLPDVPTIQRLVLEQVCLSPQELALQHMLHLMALLPRLQIDRKYASIFISSPASTALPIPAHQAQTILMQNILQVLPLLSNMIAEYTDPTLVVTVSSLIRSIQKL